MKKLLVTLGVSAAVLSYGVQDAEASSLLEDMKKLNELGIIAGDKEGNLNPGDDVTRGHMAAFLARALELPAAESSNFTDITKADDALYEEINSAYEAGIVNGYNGNVFIQNEPITRAQTVTMISNALDYLGYPEPYRVDLPFKDVYDQFSPVLRDIAHATEYDIISGYDKYTFKPAMTAQRQHAAAFISRMLELEKQPGDIYQQATIVDGQISLDPTQYDTFEDAEGTLAADELIVFGGEIVKMNDGMVVATEPVDGQTTVYQNETGATNYTYVSNLFNDQMKYLDSNGDRVKVQVADTTGYVDIENVTLYPKGMEKGQNFYSVENGNLFLNLVDPVDGLSIGEPAIIGPAPDFMSEDQMYYSWNGHDFETEDGEFAGQSYSYFAYISPRSETVYTAEEIDAYINEEIVSERPTSKLAGIGETLKEVEAEYGFNALYILSHAILESNRGTSTIALTKNNLFGLNAIDGNSLESADSFPDVETSIKQYVQVMLEEYIYIKPFEETYAFGPVYGNKTTGFNVKYAADQNWGAKIGGLYYTIDTEMGGKDLISKSYNIGMTQSIPGSDITEEGLNFRSIPQTTGNLPIYEVYEEGYPVTIVETLTENGITWHKVFADHSGEEKYAYVSADYIEILPVAKP
ncbi:S-layer homology domain-containing protein [Jeotgalibacillus sp. JSM ZJ347]|uniref:S-layer homology domain-containing protein n=1 Tax=Jeotgalibacillus sp. JSM ZJ347 TaxID=3342117 RepID=UPI0035A9281E